MYDGRSDFHLSVGPLARDLCDRLSLDQLVLLRMFGRSLAGDLKRSEFVALLDNYALELPKSRRIVVQTIAGDVSQGKDFVESLDRGKHENFKLIKQALLSAKQQTALPEFMRAVAAHQPSRRPLALLYQDTLRKQLKRLGVKTFVIFWFMATIFLNVVPEFQKMFAEFGVELPTSMLLLMVTADRFIKLSFILVILAACVFVYCLYKFKFIVRGFLRKLNPWSWLQPPNSQQQRRQLSFAWNAVDWKVPPKGKKSGFTKKEIAAFDAANSSEARSWLIRRTLRRSQHQTHRWRRRAGNAFILIWNLVLACLVGWIAIGVMSSLIAIVESHI
jgi:hypothetical protein